MFISLLLTMKISNNNGGGSRFFILMYVSACNSSFSSFYLNSSAALSGRLNVTVTVEFKRYLLAVFFFSCKSSYLHSEIQIWFAELFADLVKSSGRDLFSYPILEGKFISLA